MSFVRPEAQTALSRWRAVILSVILTMLGLWWAYVGVSPISWIGGALALLGVASLVAAIQRLRFGAGRDGPGVVQIDEGAIAYFGPLTGGVVALSNLTALSIDPSGKPAHWVLAHSGGEDLYIPVTAKGADRLFDYFSALPGMRLDRLLAASRGGYDAPTQLWRRHSEPRPGLRLR